MTGRQKRGKISLVNDYEIMGKAVISVFVDIRPFFGVRYKAACGFVVVHQPQERAFMFWWNERG